MGRFEWLEFDKNKKEFIVDQKEITKKENLEYYINKANQAFEIGEFEKSIKYYSQALNIDNYSKDGWCGQILNLICLGQYQEVLIWVDQASQFYDDPFFTSAKAFALNRLGLHDEAFQLSDDALSSPQANWFCWLTRGDILLSLGNIANAEFCFLKSVEYISDDWLPYMLIGTCFISFKIYNKAIDYLLKSLKYNRENPLIYFHLANAYNKINNVKQAITYVQMALKLKPDFIEANKLLKKLKRRNIILNIFKFFIQKKQNKRE